MTTIVKPGDQFPDIAHLSHALPLGSSISHYPHHPAFELVAPRTFALGDSPIDSTYYQQRMVLGRLSEGDEIELPRESKAEFLWRLRDTAVGAAERNGVSVSATVAMAVEFGATDPLLRVGGVVSSRNDTEFLPNGSILYSGHPDKPNLMDVWETTAEQGLRHVMGQNRVSRPAMTIYSMPGVEQVSADEPADEEEIARLALRAWRIGKAYKSRHGWCQVFEQTLAALGINDRMVAKAGSMRGPGEALDKEAVGLLPEGTLLWHEWTNRQAAAVYVRDDHGTRGMARTRRVWGYRDNGANSHDRMTIVQTPSEPMVWTVSGWVLKRMPDGVRYQPVYDDERVLDSSNRLTVNDWSAYHIRGFEV